MENNEYILNDISNDLFILNKITIDKLFSLRDDSVIILYLFYYKTAKWQKTNQIYATDDYVKKCLNWGNYKITNTKNKLKEIGLIEVIQKRDNNKISGWYIKINYLENQLNSKNSCEQDVELPRTWSQETNAYNIDNINALNNNIKMLNINNMNIIYNWNDNEICECLTQQKEKCSRRSTYKINGKNYCNQHSKLIMAIFLDKGNNRFTKPTLEEVQQYCLERNNNINAQAFIDYYESIGWKVGSKMMKDWKACVRTWENRKNQNTTNYLSNRERKKLQLEEEFEQFKKKVEEEEKRERGL